MTPELTLDRTERRIIGTLIEKALTVPDTYPLTLNALVAGCSQKSNREPVVDIPEHHIEGALKSLFMKGWVEKHSREGGRVARWAHRVPDRLHLDRPHQAILAELMLRGPQTVGALRGRASRMVPFGGTDEVLAILESLGKPERRLVERMPRRPGERGERWRHLLSTEGSEDVEVAVPASEPERFRPPPVSVPAPPPSPAPAPPPPPEDDPLAALEDEVARLREEVRSLREDIRREVRSTADSTSAPPRNPALPEPGVD